MAVRLIAFALCAACALAIENVARYECSVGDCGRGRCSLLVVDPPGPGDIKVIVGITSGLLFAISAFAAYGSVACFSAALDERRRRLHEAVRFFG